MELWRECEYLLPKLDIKESCVTVMNILVKTTMSIPNTSKGSFYAISRNFILHPFWYIGLSFQLIKIWLKLLGLILRYSTIKESA